jgi:hypothetical protein
MRRPLLFAVAAYLASCTTFERPEPCGEIPTDGCPRGDSGTCEDPVCAALYDCVDGSWSLAEECPGFVAGGGGVGAEGGDAGGGVGGGLAAGGAGGCGTAIDLSREVSGCAPELQAPDCPADIVLSSCEPCGGECLDFFLCKEEGWVSVAFCSPEGELVVIERP